MDDLTVRDRPARAAAADAATARIFVNIAAYRDSECQWTVKDLFEKARHPDRIFVGLCWQFVPAEDQDCFLVTTRPEQCRSIEFDANQSFGACWARHHAESLWRGEEYCLQIDSHMRFVEGWDARAIEMLESCPSEKSVLSAYPPGYTPPDKLHDPGIVISYAAEFLDNGLIRVSSRSVPEEKAPPAPIPTAFIAGGFVFGPSRMIQEVPYDPHLYFWGEELTLAARLWTHGWDIYVPNRVICYHDYTQREGRRRHWDDNKEWGRINDLSYKRARHLLGREATEDAQALRELDRYGLGTARSLAEFYAYSGVDYRNRTIDGKSIEQLWMEQPEEERRKRHRDIFAGIRWGDGESRSGPGSAVAATAPIRTALPPLFQFLGIRLLADAGCGDCNWASQITENLDFYLGYDVVPEIVAEARGKVGSRRGHFFAEADITLDLLPRSDAILCRDVLTHLPAPEVQAALRRFKESGSRYLIATTFERSANDEVSIGGWQPIALTAAPFNLPPPRHLISEMVPGTSKSLGVWLLQDIPELP